MRFEARLPSRFVAHCHCDHCRQAHGAASVTWAGIHDDLPRFGGEDGVTPIVGS